MKKYFFLACLLASSILFFTQCKKNDAAPATAAGNFSPLTTGSNWTYKYTEGSVSNTIKLTATANSKAINGKSYKILTADSGDTSYLAKDGNDYFQFASFPAIGIYNVEELYLKDNVDVNGTWSTATSITYSGIPLKVNLNFTIKGKGEARTVNGVSFANVTHVRLDIDLSGSKAGGGDFYYQEGVGLIEDSLLITTSFTPPYSSKEEIIAYQIK